MRRNRVWMHLSVNLHNTVCYCFHQLKQLTLFRRPSKKYSFHKQSPLKERIITTKHIYTWSTTVSVPSSEKKLGPPRVSSKQTKINFGLNRNKPKQDLFRVFFGLFRCFEPISKQPKQTEMFRNKPKQP